jgi:hypothetical protein
MNAEQKMADIPNQHPIIRKLEDKKVQRWITYLLCVAALASFILIRRGGDLAWYLLMGRKVLDGEWAYYDPMTTKWPPFFTVICVPLALLASPSVYLARGVWLALNYVALFIALRLIAKFVYNKPMDLSPETENLNLGSPEILIPLLLTFRYLLSNLEHLQINLILFAMVLGGLALQKNKKEFVGGMLIGAAASLKLMSLAFVPYFIYKRKWRSAAFTSLWIVLFSLSPILMFGWSTFWKYVNEFKAAMDLGWWSGSMNHSVSAMWDRIIGYGIIPFFDKTTHGYPISGNPMARVASLISLAIVAVISAWIFYKRPKNEIGGAVRWWELAEWSVVFIVANIFGPVTWNAFLVVLLLPNMLLFAIWLSQMDQKTKRVAWLAMVVPFVLSLISTPGLVGHTITVILHMSSIITLAVLFLLWGMLTLRARL